MAVLSDGKKKVEISFESEEEAIQNTIATHPVQRGNPIVDHTQRESQTWEFKGKIFGKNQTEIDKKFQQLINWQFYGNLLTYHGAVHHGNMLISELHKTYDEGGYKNALEIDISLTWVMTVTSSFVGAKNTGPKSPTKGSATKKGTYITVKAGDTYWAWASRYGTSIPTLRSWNKWADTRIPIGAKARVK
ncbi:LysM peptidoglycan-binding domain-containing protein [Lacticaseibacillus saniviri]|uniref:LysM domain-containing protein n=1 Tax=Lacticaseibacillus saniviri JCM 17471 = DSM 24301 TaxID=1293598 RepID=A0A0R2MUC7_9LACO|nr:LysM peptidoglycan-binding domain-containing protein [Lacticaseibacillus saniviri]KRO15904.1 hypothetical protein IV56_GL002095 [Lacticaseibacillus saniviri JCM 17471 = DSM 24301]